jgi:hypothetical protein
MVPVMVLAMPAVSVSPTSACVSTPTSAMSPARAAAPLQKEYRQEEQINHPAYYENQCGRNLRDQILLPIEKGEHGTGKHELEHEKGDDVKNESPALFALLLFLLFHQLLVIVVTHSGTIHFFGRAGNLFRRKSVKLPSKKRSRNQRNQQAPLIPRSAKFKRLLLISIL